MFDIHIINETEQVPDTIKKLNLDRDIIFSFLSDTKHNIYFNYSGVIRFSLGSEINLSMTQNKSNPNSPLRTFRNKIDMKFCCPCGIAPLFTKPSESKSILSNMVSYQNFLDVKIDSNPIIGGKNLTSNKSVIYQNINVETIFNKDVLVKEYPSMVLSPSFKLFDLILCQTIFSDTLSIDNVYIINSTEFYNKFKEAI